MQERVLILSKDQTALKLPKSIEQRTEGVVDLLFLETAIPLDELGARYDIIVVDKHFNGHSLYTSRLVSSIRTKFTGPIIGLELHSGDGNSLTMQVAGCNFMLYLVGANTEEVCAAVCQEIAKISSGLEDFKKLAHNYAP